MDEINVISKTQKSLRERLQQIGDAILAGGVDNMEKYKYMLLQILTYKNLNQKLSTLLTKMNQN